MINFRVWTQFGQALSGIKMWFRDPTVSWCWCWCCYCAGCPLAAWEEPQLACVLSSIREATLSYSLAILTSSVMPQRKGLKGLWEEEACLWSSMHPSAPRASSQLRPLPLPMPLPAPWAASPSAASHGPSAEQPASQLGTGAPKTGQGFTTRARWELTLKSILKTI